MAALTVAVMVIPQSMAYAILAGIPAVYGLYTALISFFVYPLIGTSRFLSVGPVALIAILLMSGLINFSQPFSQEYIFMAIVVSLLSGIILVILSVLKLGYMVNFLSHPVISGFTSAAAVIIIISQLKYFFGVDVERSNTVIGNIKNLLPELNKSNIWAIGICTLSMLGIFSLKKWNKKIPSELIFVVLTSFVVYHFNLSDQIKVIGELPSGLPSFTVPLGISFDDIVKLVPLSIVIALISFIQSLAISKSLQSNHGGNEINADRELLALGITKITSAFFQGFPSTGGFSRSAINVSAGAQTGWASIISAVFIALSLLFLTQWFNFIPFAVLAAIIIIAVTNLIDFNIFKKLYQSDKSDWGVLMATFSLTLLFGVQTGIIIGIGLSIFQIIRIASKPHYAVLGKVDEDLGIYRNIKRFKDAEINDNIVIIRYDEDLFFGNSQHFTNCVLSEINQRPKTDTLILDMSSISNIDSTGIIQFKTLLQKLKKMNIDIHLCGRKGPLRDRLHFDGVDEIIGEENIHMTIEKTMRKIKAKT